LKSIMETFFECQIVVARQIAICLESYNVIVGSGSSLCHLSNLDPCCYSRIDIFKHSSYRVFESNACCSDEVETVESFQHLSLDLCFLQSCMTVQTRFVVCHWVGVLVHQD
jgi:hypothetical protein